MQQAISAVLKLIEILVKNGSLFVSNNVDLVSPKSTGQLLLTYK